MQCDNIYYPMSVRKHKKEDIHNEKVHITVVFIAYN